MADYLNIDAQDWIDWKANKVTKKFFEIIDEMRQVTLEGRMADPGNADKTQFLAGYKEGALKAIQNMQELDLKPVEPEATEGDEV